MKIICFYTIRILFAPLLVLLSGCGSHSSDQELLSLFKSNSNSFVSVVNDLREVGFTGRILWVEGRLSTDGFIIPISFSNRLSSNLTVVNRNLDFRSDRSGDRVWITLSRRGLSISGSSKGLVYYATDKPVELVLSTDIYRKRKGPFTVFVPLAPNWFIFFDR